MFERLYAAAMYLVNRNPHVQALDPLLSRSVRWVPLRAGLNPASHCATFAFPIFLNDRKENHHEEPD